MPVAILYDYYMYPLLNNANARTAYKVSVELNV